MSWHFCATGSSGLAFSQPGVRGGLRSAEMCIRDRSWPRGSTMPAALGDQPEAARADGHRRYRWPDHGHSPEHAGGAGRLHAGARQGAVRAASLASQGASAPAHAAQLPSARGRAGSMAPIRTGPCATPPGPIAGSIAAITCRRHDEGDVEPAGKGRSGAPGRRRRRQR